MLKFLKTCIKISDSFSDLIGKTASWCAVLMVVMTFYIVLTRYVFNTGTIAIQESIIYFSDSEELKPSYQLLWRKLGTALLPS